MPSTDSERGTVQAKARRAPQGAPARKKNLGRRAKKRKQFRDLTVEAVVMLILFVLCFFMVLGSYDTGGALGKVLGTMEWGLFGSLSHFFPLVFYFGAAFLLENKFRPLAYKKMAGVWGLFLCICGFIQRFTDGYLESYSAMDYYARSADYHVAGGAFGGILCMTLTSAFGKVFGVVVLILLSLCCVIIILRRSLVDFILDMADLLMGIRPGFDEQQREQVLEERKQQRAERLEAKIARENASLDVLAQEEEEKLKEKEARRAEKQKRAQEEKARKLAAREEEKKRREEARAAREAALEAAAEDEDEEGEEPVPGNPALDLKSKFSPQIFGFPRRRGSQEPEEEGEDDLTELEGEVPTGEEGTRIITPREKESAGLRRGRIPGLRNIVSELRKGLEDTEDEEENEKSPAPAKREEEDVFTGLGDDFDEEGDDPFAQAEKARKMASLRNPSAGEEPVNLGDIGLIGEDE